MSPHGAPPAGDSPQFDVPIYVCNGCGASYESYAPSRCSNTIVAGETGPRVCGSSSFTLQLP